MRKIVILWIALLILNFSPSAGYANELIDPKIFDDHTNAIVGWKQYFLEENNGAKKIIIKDSYNEIPIISFHEGDNYVDVLPDSETKAKPVRIVEYTKSALVHFTKDGIKLVDHNGKPVSLAYPEEKTFPQTRDEDFYRVIRSVSDGEDVYFILAGKLYLLSTQNQKITYLTYLKDFQDDLAFLSVSKRAGSDYKLVSVSESYGEPHLGFQGHSIFIKKDQVINYWMNESYGGGGVMPAYFGEDLVAATQGGQLATYTLPTLQSKKYALNMKQPGIVFANQDYAVLHDDQGMMEILDLRTGKMEKPYQTLYNDAQKQIVEEEAGGIFQPGDSLEFGSVQGDEFIFYLKNVYRFEPPAGNVYDYTQAPVYQYTYHYQTKVFEFQKIENHSPELEASPLINDGDRKMTIKESVENLTIYHDEEKISTIPYPRKYLGTDVTENLRRAFYVENIKTGEKKESIFVIKTRNLNNYSEKQEKIKLPEDCFNTILNDALSAVPYGNDTYLVTKNRIYRVSGAKIVKTIEIPHIEQYSAGPDKIYLFDQTNIHVLDLKTGQVQLMGKNEYSSARMNHLHPIQRNEMTGEISQIEDAYQRTFQQGEIKTLLFPFAENYRYAEPVFTDGTKGYCLIIDNAVLKLPESLKNKSYSVYLSTAKEYGPLVKKYYKITVSMEDVDWEYIYQTEYLSVITKTKAKIFYHNQEIPSNTYPVMQNGSLLIPIEQVAGQMGVEFAFDEKNGLITLKKDHIIIGMTVNSIKASVNDETVELNSPPILHDGNVMVPLRFICEKLGFKNRLEYDYENPAPAEGSRISKVYID
ncbi:MAG: copper amine oxidase N-terminal domain-containing protein [Dehalobacterium sp.]